MHTDCPTSFLRSFDDTNMFCQILRDHWSKIQHHVVPPVVFFEFTWFAFFYFWTLRVEFIEKFNEFFFSNLFFYTSSRGSKVILSSTILPSFILVRKCVGSDFFLFGRRQGTRITRGCFLLYLLSVIYGMRHGSMAGGRQQQKEGSTCTESNQRAVLGWHAIICVKHSRTVAASTRCTTLIK